jgi:hypothetical protein
MRTYPQSRTRPNQEEAVRQIPQKTGCAQLATSSSTGRVTLKRSRATLAEVVNALSYVENILTVVFRAKLKFTGINTYAVFLTDPQTAFPLSGGCEPGSSRLRLLLERSGVGAVGRSMMVDALNATDIPIIDLSNFDISDDWKPFRLPDGALRELKSRLGGLLP